MNTSEYWLISAPGEKTGQQTFDRLNQATSKQQLSTNSKFNIPDLKVGTLDQLVGLSDDLGKLDIYVEQITRKVANYLGEVLEEQRDKLAENLLAGGVDLPTYINHFRWDMAKYPIKQSLKNLSEIIAKQVGQIESDLKNKAAAYNGLKSSLQNIEKKQTGSLVARNLGDLVKKEHFVLDSEYLTTLLVVVPLSTINDWNLKYEKLTDMVVPRSSQLVYQDNDHALVTVSLFIKVVDEFKNKARECRFLVRDFSYNDEELKAGKTELTKLHTDKKKQFGPLVRWLKVNFGECFTAWIHVKALRVFVESVLRFGLPVNFQGMLLLPQKKQMKKLREVLNDLYLHLDTAGTIGGSEDIPTGLGLGQGEYYPYVYYKMNIDMIATTSVLN
ncbi:V-type proton ATPase subunit C [Eurytemora carolleeae]|uniref:V-type proton ATPase subunit C n=1 Tax=Eurytemora carolleeae TaxID=1294199 RepID=UPI000C77506A|nr:V-type proton ATPase subunit C [Eurytemora carolleeae]|eukprot:XP_023344359.1 V-type proton ATPase subunit C-like [Eurytemora affinis]